MEWRDEGFVLGARSYGESSQIVFLLTKEHGRHAGFVRGAKRSRYMRGAVEAGNLLAAHWRARLVEHMGAYTLEGLEFFATGFMDNPPALEALQALCALTPSLPERTPCAALYFRFGAFVRNPRDWLFHAPRFEYALIAELGYGFAPEEARKLAMPEWVFAHNEKPVQEWTQAESIRALTLTGRRLYQHVFRPRPLPPMRLALARRLANG